MSNLTKHAKTNKVGNLEHKETGSENFDQYAIEELK